MIPKLPLGKLFDLEAKKAVTLIEILLVVMLSALLMAAIIPFIRSVNETWSAGSSRTEILQNGRSALEMMTRYIRQSRRITVIPGSSGNYIKIRDRDDRYNIIFYHNVSGSPYYIGASGNINDNDLVMRSDPSGTYENSLLAPSFQNLTFNFLGDDGMPVTAANQVKSVQIQMVLSDPSGSTTHTLALESTINLRQDVKISSPIWFSHANQVGELSLDIWVDGFSNPNSVSVNPTDGSCWVADTGNSRIKKLSSTGTILVNVTAATNQPRSVSVNSSTGECWVADTKNSRIKKLSSAGAVLVDKLIAKSKPQSVSVYPSDGSCWFTDTGNNRIKKLSSDGKTILVDISGFNQPQSVSVNPTTGECWVADTGNSRIKKLSSTGTILVNVTAATNQPRSVSANSSTGECWVTDTSNNSIKKLSSTGTVLVNISGFNQPSSVSVNSSDGSCWVADTVNNKIIKLNSEGDREFEIGGFNNPLSVSAR